MPNINNIPTTQYVGPRIIPHLWNPIAWDATTQYDALAVVQYNGDGYVSRYIPPVGTLPTDDEYWVKWADFNAQLANLQQTVDTFDGRIDGVETVLPVSDFSTTNTVSDAINVNTNDISYLFKRFETFQQLGAFADVEVGKVYATCGFKNAYDGGGAIYRAVSDSSAWSLPGAVNGVYFDCIPINIVNASALGCIGTTDAASIARAKALSESKKLPIVFPSDITTSETITLGNYPMYIQGTVNYTGTGYALEIVDMPNSRLDFNTVYAPNGSGLHIHQQDPEKVIYNPRVNGYAVNAGLYGVTLEADTYGILNGIVTVNRIDSVNDGLRLICNQLSTTIHRSFIGQMVIDTIHITSTNGHAVRMICPSPATITGIYFTATSFENSAYGLQSSGTGEVKMIEFESLRVLETDSFTNIIDLSGNIFYTRIHCQSPIRIDKIVATTTNPYGKEPIIIDGGIISPTFFRFADSMFVSSEGRTFRTEYCIGQNQNENFVFMSNTMSYRCFREFRCIDGTNHTIRNLEYFSPFGINTIYLNQNKDNGSTFQLYDMNNNLIFDGTAVTDTGRTTYEIRVIRDGNTNKYAINKVNGTPIS